MKNDPVVGTKERILDAVARVVNRVGFIRATIDEIILEAGVSKGGFLYHFPAKTDCFLALIDRTFEGIHRDATARASAMPDMPGRMLRAYIEAWLEWQEPPRNLQVVGIIEEPVLRERLVAHRIAHYEMVLDEQVPEELVQTLLLICAGLWTTPQLAKATPAEMTRFRQRMRVVMMNMIDAGIAEEGKWGG